MIKRNTAHKTTHTIKDTLHRMNTNTNIRLLANLKSENEDAYYLK
jgi:hypothetical protein